MRTLLSSDRLRPTRLLYRSINPKPFSSQSPIQPISQLKPPNPIPNQNDAVDDDANVIQTLLTRKNDPVSALEYCNWVRPHNRHGGDLFWVLIHILVTSPHTHHRANNLLVLFVSANPHLSPSVTATQLLDSAQRFGLGPDPRAFNYLLNAYIRNKRVNDAVECFKLMVERKFVPFVCYVNSVLSSLVRSNEIGEAKEVYRKMVEVGVSGDNVTAQLLMRGCLRERRPEEALRIFKRVVRGGRDALMYSLAVQAACKVNDLELGLGLLREMREELGVCGSQETYTSVVVACVKGGKVEEAVRVKDEMVGLGIPVSVVAATSLVSGYCKEGEFCKALELFEVVEGAPDKVMFSVMIEWCCRKGVVEKAVEVYKRMRVAGITPSSVVVHMVIKACLRGESPETALEIFDDGYEMGVADGYVCNTILQLLCKQGKVDAGRSLMKVMEDRGIEINVVSYNNMMLAHCRMKDMELARSVYSVMLEKGLEPTNFTYSILIDGFFKNRDEESACDVINQMISRNFEASEVVYNTIINGLCKVGQTSKAREMLQELVKEKRYSFSCMSYNSIIDGFFREGETDSAVETYREMTTSENGVSPNVVTFTSLINGFCKSGRMDLVLEMRQEMERKDVKLDVPAYGALIDGFCKKQDMKTAVSLFSELVELGLVPNVSVYNSLISGFRNVGDMVAAVDLYKKMVSDGVKCDLFTYTTLIDGLLKDGDLISASGLYSEVVALGMVPDEVLLVVLVNGLSKKGQFLKASKMLEELKRRGDVTPNVLIYTSVIAGHYREGSLDKAFQIQEEMIEKGLEYDHAVFDLLVSGKVEKTHAACSQG